MGTYSMVPTDIGRPLKFKDAKALQSTIDNYFKTRDELNKPYTITGLALALDCNIKTLQRYNECEDKDKICLFSIPIKRAYAKCFDYCYEGMLTARNPAGFIFAAKNYGMTDAQTIDHTVTNKTITVQMVGDIDDD